MSPELEQTLSMLSSHRSVLGYMLVTRGHHPSIIRHSGVVFDGEQGKRYAAVVARIVESVQAGLEEVRVDDGLTAAAIGETDVVRAFLLSDAGLVWENSLSNISLYLQGWGSIYENPNQETWNIDLPRYVNGTKQITESNDFLYQTIGTSSLYYMIQLHDRQCHIFWPTFPANRSRAPLFPSLSDILVRSRI